MTPRDLLKRVKKTPFAPFRLTVSEGISYDVLHPDQIIVTRDAAIIAAPASADGLYETTDLVDLIHVVRLEPLPAKKVKS